MSKKINWLQVAVGLGIAAATVLDVLPGDEIVGVPLGIGVALDGMGYL